MPDRVTHPPALDCIAVIPCHNESRSIAALITAVRIHLTHVIVVDDGSTDSTSQLAQEAGAEVLRFPSNQGKGAAVQAGLKRAKELGYQWALLMDGDGQHSPDDIPGFLKAAAAGDETVQFIGNRMIAPGEMPFIRQVTNRVMSAMLSRLTGTSLPDTQCGFRLMRLDACPPLPAHCTRYEVESELLLASLAAGQSVAFVPVQCRYAAAPSRIRPIRDTIRWGLWLWRSRGRFAAARARGPLRIPLADGAKTKALSPLTKNENAAPVPAPSWIRRGVGVLRRIAVLAAMAFVMGAAMDWSARRSRPDQPAGFWWGMLHGALMPASMPMLFFGKDVAIYAPHNRGIPYKLGYTMGVNGCGALFFGMAFWRPGRRGPVISNQ